jgi:hypothetical protein
MYGDVYGPFKVKYLGLVQYFIMFIIDFSQRIWTYLVKQKSEAMSKFKYIRKINIKKKKCFINNDGKYISYEFSKYLATTSITRQLTQLRTP